MRFGKRFSLRSLWLFLSILGPGLITANADNDVGGIATYSLAGSQYGYSMLWTLIPITGALIIVQEMCARMGAITGKGLADLIRESFGLRITVGVMGGLLVAGLLNTIAEFSGVAASMEMVGVSRYISVPLSAWFVWWLVVKGSYGKVEKYFLTACLFYVTYLVSGFLAHPDWHQVAHDSFVPTFKMDAGYLSTLIGVVGTTIAPWMQFYMQSAIVEKRIGPEQYPWSRIDVVVGCVLTDVIAFFMVVACAATIYANHVPVHEVKDVAAALTPLAGHWSTLLFAFGLLNASVFTACILPLATTYTICEGMGWQHGVDCTFEEAPWFVSLYTAIIVVGAGVILLPHAPLLGIMFWSQVMNGMLLPFVLIPMLLLINNRRIMGEHVNGPVYNVLSWLTVGIVLVLTVMLLGTSIFGGGGS